MEEETEAVVFVQKSGAVLGGEKWQTTLILPGDIQELFHEGADYN